MLNLSTKISVTVLIVLAVTHYSCAMSAAAAQAVAGANAILNNASIPQEYKVNIHDYSITSACLPSKFCRLMFICIQNKIHLNFMRGRFLCSIIFLCHHRQAMINASPILFTMYMQMNYLYHYLDLIFVALLLYMSYVVVGYAVCGCWCDLSQ